MHRFALAILPAALFAAPPLLAAPPQHTMTMKPPAPSTAIKVSPAALHKFANAYEDVRQVRVEYITKIKTAKGSDQKKAIKKQAVKEMKQHISRYMPVSRYIQIGKEINTNPALRKRLMAILQADQKKAGAGSGSGSI